jgi:hypothetical protein
MLLEVFQANPFWLFLSAAFVFAVLIILYAQGILVVVYKDRYYGVTRSNFFTDVTDQYICHQELSESLS